MVRRKEQTKTTRLRGRPKDADKNALPEAELLEAVLQAFAEAGYEGTSVREVARSLGVSHNLFPQRFGSKEKLWYAAVDYGFGQLALELEAEAAALGHDEVQVLRGLVARFIALNAAHPALLQIINQEATRPGPRLDYLFDTYISPVRDFGRDWLDRLAKEGKIAPTSVTLLYFLMTHGAGGMFAMPALTQRLTNGQAPAKADDLKAEIENAVNVIFDGMLTKGT